MYFSHLQMIHNSPDNSEIFNTIVISSSFMSDDGIVTVGQQTVPVAVSALFINPSDLSMVENDDRMTNEKILNTEQQANFFAILKNRFENPPKHYVRPKDVTYEKVKSALENDPIALYALNELEYNEHEVDVIDIENNEIIFATMALESPNLGITYRYAVQPFLNTRATIMTEIEYRKLLKIGQFDNKTRTWLFTYKEKLDQGYALTGCSHENEPSFSFYEVKSVWPGVRFVLKVKM